MSDLTRKELIALGEFCGGTVKPAITQLLAQLDAANAKLSLHESDNVALDRALEQMRERCAVSAESHGINDSVFNAAFYIRALPLHEDQKL